MSNLTVGSISGMPLNGNVISVPSGHTIKQSGGILQVLSVTKTDTWTAATSVPINIPGLSVSITPKFIDSKIFLIAHVPATTNTSTSAVFRFSRNSLPVGVGDIAGNRQRVTSKISSGNTAWMNTASLTYLDSPNSIEEQVYTIQAMSHNSGYTIYVNRNLADGDSANGDESRSASTLTVMEIAS